MIYPQELYKVKIEDGSLRLKTKLVRHGKRDYERDLIRKVSTTAEKFLTRTIITIVGVNIIYIAAADVEGAYIQSGRIIRNINYIPPNNVHEENKTLCNPTRLPYGITEAFRQCRKTEKSG